LKLIVCATVQALMQKLNSLQPFVTGHMQYAATSNCKTCSVLWK